jgi:phage terminase large subunit-like protein
MVAYDRFAFARFERTFTELGLEYGIRRASAGGLKKGKPTEAMKAAAKVRRPRSGRTVDAGSLRSSRTAILERRIRLKRNPVLISAMMSAVTDEDKWDNRWLAKAAFTNKIDAAVALCMAMGAAQCRFSKPAFEMLII